MMDKPYEQWKTEIKAWMYTADAADKNKAALTVALSLPEKGCNNIRQRIFNSVTFFTQGGTQEAPVEKISDNAWKDLIAENYSMSVERCCKGKQSTIQM